MGSKVEPAKLEDLLALFENIVQPADIMYAKISSQASRSITKERIRLNMRQKEFADYIHSQQSLVSRWESGDYNFTLRKLSEISVALDMDLHIFMTPRCLQKQLFISADTTRYSEWTKVRKVQMKRPLQNDSLYYVTTVLNNNLSAPQNYINFTSSEFYKEILSC